ncbi:DoxX family protein [Burkholderia alba]|uniref:DoxX family protein n=1 Tax=Burkholderia alba TaxID=2683677 RepID=UPI002B05C321|nr:hypothetical protein [Burkholderia alba]
MHAPSTAATDTAALSMPKKIGLFVVFVWFFSGGIGHFVMTPFFVSIVPPSIPHPYAAVYISAVFELLGAIGILLRPTRQLAGYGLALLTLCVTPANVYMWQHPALFPTFAPSLLLLRLVVQVLLLWCILWSTRPTQERA